MSVSSQPVNWCVRIALALLTALILVDCLPQESEGDLGEPTLATVQEQIFTPKCALSSCHAGGAPQEGMSLEPGKVQASTFNVTAVESTLKRINPGDPDQSYLVAKIEGRARAVGGSGGRMPLGYPPLSHAEIQLVRDWITSTGVPSTASSLVPATGVPATGQDKERQ